MKYLSSVLIIMAIALTNAFGQGDTLWHFADYATDGIPGISLHKAKAALSDRTASEVIVAIIDDGFDTDHEALKDLLWINVSEVAGNGVDDDANGYADDMHGWSFLGGKDGNITYETLELTREYRRLRPLFENKPASTDPEYKYWKMVSDQYLEAKASADESEEEMNLLVPRFELLTGYTRRDYLTINLLDSINSCDPVVQDADEYYTEFFSGFTFSDESIDAKAEPFTLNWLKEVLGYEGDAVPMNYEADYWYNADFNPRSIVGDDQSNPNEIHYGSSAINLRDSVSGVHGTHVAGIVGNIVRTGTTGKTPVKLMLLRAVPDGDERDKDVASSIRYAVDNGAKIINMSFGKDLSPHTEVVRAAMKYAADNNVLLIHAAGNESADIDKVDNYPDGYITDDTKASTWMNVGATTPTYDENLLAYYSNYGTTEVDIFAPGDDIYSSIPYDQYEEMGGTSMAAPVVAGVAALLWSHYPSLTAVDIKEILMQSVMPVDFKVADPRTGKVNKKFNKLSVAGGLLNAYQAVEMVKDRVGE